MMEYADKIMTADFKNRLFFSPNSGNKNNRNEFSIHYCQFVLQNHEPINRKVLFPIMQVKERIFQEIIFITLKF